MQLLRFRQDHQFCSRCGTPTELHPIENATVCP
ncbi:NADH pyrophosphatase zinc ribbon domain-containing protein, partial [Acinetobacter baumannii]